LADGEAGADAVVDNGVVEAAGGEAAAVVGADSGEVAGEGGGVGGFVLGSGLVGGGGVVLGGGKSGVVLERLAAGFGEGERGLRVEESREKEQSCL
jgi:hypothetical protein